MSSCNKRRPKLFTVGEQGPVLPGIPWTEMADLNKGSLDNPAKGVMLKNDNLAQVLPEQLKEVIRRTVITEEIHGKGLLPRMLVG